MIYFELAGGSVGDGLLGNGYDEGIVDSGVTIGDGFSYLSGQEPWREGGIGLDDYWGGQVKEVNRSTTGAREAIQVGLTNDVWAPVPIPGAVWLLGSGLLGMLGIRRKLKK